MVWPPWLHRAHMSPQLHSCEDTRKAAVGIIDMAAMGFGTSEEGEIRLAKSHATPGELRGLTKRTESVARYICWYDDAC